MANKFYIRNVCDYALQRIDDRILHFDGKSVEEYETIRVIINDFNMGLDILLYENDALTPEAYHEMKTETLMELNTLIDKFNED